MTRCNDNLGSGCLDLFGFDLSRGHPSFLERRTHRNVTPSATATMIVLSVWCHISEVICQLPNNVSSLFPQAAIPRYVAGVLIGHRNIQLFGRVDFDTTISKIFIKELDTMDDFNRGLSTG